MSALKQKGRVNGPMEAVLSSSETRSAQLPRVILAGRERRQDMRRMRIAADRCTRLQIVTSDECSSISIRLVARVSLDGERALPSQG